MRFTHNTWLVACALLCCGLLLLASSCSSVSAVDEDAGTGAIYGRVSVEDEAAPPTQVVVALESVGTTTTPDAQGFFYLPNVPPGSYRVSARLPDFEITEREDVEVRPDSISLITRIRVESNHRTTGRLSLPWRGRRIQRVDLSRRGGIVGYVEDPIGQRLEGPAVYVVLEDTPWGTGTNAHGNYEIRGVFPGTYEVESSTAGLISYTFKVRVVADSLAVLNLTLIDDYYPGGYAEWEEAYVPYH